MLYLSIIFVVFGIFLILYSILGKNNIKDQASPKKTPFQQPSDDIVSSISNNELKPFDDIEDKTGNIRGHNRKEKAFNEYSAHTHTDALVSDQIDNEIKEDITEAVNTHADYTKKKGGEETKEKGIAPGEIHDESREEVRVILFDDYSRIIDYNNGGLIDPTVEDFNKLHRVGRGRIELIKDGINFHIDKKFYRFDFYRIDDMILGNNFIALSLKGSNMVRLFLFEKESRLKNDIYKAYKGAF
jgi:hypothetical protein